MNERSVTIRTADGLGLAGRVHTPDAPTGRAVVAHPHPRYGGTMDNAVVVLAVERAARRRLATVRFDFRGAGGSDGQFDDGRGEADDLRAALALADELAGVAGERVLLGYSFGAAVAAAAVRSGAPVDRLVLVAPPITIASVRLPAPPRAGLWVIVGDHDGYCPLADAERLVARPGGERPHLRVIPGADHFFAFTMGPLAEALDEALLR